MQFCYEGTPVELQKEFEVTFPRNSETGVKGQAKSNTRRSLLADVVCRHNAKRRLTREHARARALSRDHVLVCLWSCSLPDAALLFLLNSKLLAICWILW